jgi:hypothetical protein
MLLTTQKVYHPKIMDVIEERSRRRMGICPKNLSSRLKEDRLPLIFKMTQE